MLSIEEAYNLCMNNPNLVLRDDLHSGGSITDSKYYTGRFVACTPDRNQFQFKYAEDSNNHKSYMWYYTEGNLGRFSIVSNKSKLPINYKGEQCGTK